jgi:site-specific DNA recombinase
LFQMAVSKKESSIRIINEPLKGSSVFMVETGENCSLARTQFITSADLVISL